MRRGDGADRGASLKWRRAGDLRRNIEHQNIEHQNIEGPEDIDE
jgi:hypothetical protein